MGPTSSFITSRAAGISRSRGYSNTTVSSAAPGWTLASMPSSPEIASLSLGAKSPARKASVRAMLSALNLSCAELLRGSQGSPSPYPRSRQSSMRSMSSEKRWMSPKHFERLVPPLKTMPPECSNRWKRRSSAQQTHGSFSTMAGAMPMSAAARSTSTPRSAPGSLISPSTGLPPALPAPSLISRAPPSAPWRSRISMPWSSSSRRRGPAPRRR